MVLLDCWCGWYGDGCCQQLENKKSILEGEDCDKKDFLVLAFSVLGGGQGSRMSRKFTLITSDSSTKQRGRNEGEDGIGLSDLGFALLGLLYWV